ncbi:MAG: sulfatase [Rikenellaceae bacterium]
MKNNRGFYPFLILSTMPIMGSCAGSQGSTEQPNIIYIMSDDHTSAGIGAYGGRFAPLNPTPNIDRIGKEGIIMQNAFCTNAISTPSRACIISGQYSQTTGILDFEDPMDIEKQHLPIEMKKLGYQTAIVGKWHLGNQPEMFDYYNVFYGQGEYFDPVLSEKGSDEKTKLGGRMVNGHRYEGHCSDVVCDIALDWFKNKRDKSKPFLFCYQDKAPHDMFEFNPKYADYLEDTFMPEPASLWNNSAHGSVATRGYNDSMRDTIGSSVGRRNTVRNMGTDLKMDIADNVSDENYKRMAYQEYMKRYFRCVKGVDDNIGRLFEYLEAEGLMDNTIIIYTGDQGFFLGEHDYIDKRWMYDETMRMPFLVRYPKKIKAGSTSDAIVNNVDFAGTMIDMAGGEVPEYMQGESFKEILYTGKEPEGWKQASYYRYWMHMGHNHNNPGHFGIRTKEYKLIFFYAEDFRPDRKWAPYNKCVGTKTPVAWELYDLKRDPNEMQNVYGRPEYAEITKQLKAQLKELREELNETDAAYPEIRKVIDENWDL